jgi:hypothetical protein
MRGIIADDRFQTIEIQADLLRQVLRMYCPDVR